METPIKITSQFNDLVNYGFYALHAASLITIGLIMPAVIPYQTPVLALLALGYSAHKLKKRKNIVKGFEKALEDTWQFQPAPTKVHKILEKLFDKAGMSTEEITATILYSNPHDNKKSLAVCYSPDFDLFMIRNDILDKLSDKELESVLAHELSHRANLSMHNYYLDTACESLNDSMKTMGLIALITLNVPAAAIYFSTYAAGKLSKLRLLRLDEKRADQNAVKLTNDSKNLKSALTKLHNDAISAHTENDTSKAQMEKIIKFTRIFSKHPSLSNRKRAADRMYSRLSANKL